MKTFLTNFDLVVQVGQYIAVIIAAIMGSLAAHGYKLSARQKQLEAAAQTGVRYAEQMRKVAAAAGTATTPGQMLQHALGAAVQIFPNAGCNELRVLIEAALQNPDSLPFTFTAALSPVDSPDAHKTLQGIFDPLPPVQVSPTVGALLTPEQQTKVDIQPVDTAVVGNTSDVSASVPTSTPTFAQTLESVLVDAAKSAATNFIGHEVGIPPGQRNNIAAFVEQFHFTIK